LRICAVGLRGKDIVIFYHAMLVLFSLDSTGPISSYRPRSILVQHVQHARFPRKFLATSLRGSHEYAMIKTASVEFKLICCHHVYVCVYVCLHEKAQIWLFWQPLAP